MTTQGEDCDHIWIASAVKEDGTPDFRMNTQMSNEPHVHVTCQECNVRTWMNEPTWNALPAVNPDLIREL